MTLKQKYGGTYNPKTSKLIILMDGYDEIAGGYQQNLYDSQQLEQYSQNIRVIITCRTQYLAPGYQQWFKPAESDFKEFEIQPFSNGQISQYLKKYSEEARKVNKEIYTEEKYQEKIAALPGLKELIKNPFILRLTVESLPWLEKFLKEETKHFYKRGGANYDSKKRRSKSKRYSINKSVCYLQVLHGTLVYKTRTQNKAE